MASLGLTTLNELEIHEVDVAPSVSGVDAPIGSLAILTDGSKIYLKSGSLSTNWSPVNSLDRSEYSFILSSVQTSSSTTYTTITQLTSTSLPAGFYKVECYLICQSTATSVGIGLRVGSVTAAISNPTAIRWGISQAGNGTSKFFSYDQTSSTDNITSTASPSANTNFLAIGTGIINITTAGTIAIQLRSENTNSVSVRPNSVFFIKAMQ